MSFRKKLQHGEIVIQKSMQIMPEARPRKGKTGRSLQNQTL